MESHFPSVISIDLDKDETVNLMNSDSVLKQEL